MSWGAYVLRFAALSPWCNNDDDDDDSDDDDDDNDDNK